MIAYELKNSCPFCGKKLIVVSFEVFPGADLETTFFEPECETDDCTVNDLERYYDTPEEAAEAWDRRASLWRTDPPPKNGTEILAKTSFGVRIVKWENLYVFPGSCTFASGWLIVGGNFLYTAEIQEWKEIPK
jgi:hypothetical protein